jgi:hypothetical protein
VRALSREWLFAAADGRQRYERVRACADFPRLMRGRSALSHGPRWKAPINAYMIDILEICSPPGIPEHSVVSMSARPIPHSRLIAAKVGAATSERKRSARRMLEVVGLSRFNPRPL